VLWLKPVLYGKSLYPVPIDFVITLEVIWCRG